MDVRLSEAIAPVKLALIGVAEKSSKRRLTVYGDKIPCAPGCSGCCSRLISITVAEAVLIYSHLSQFGRWAAISLECRKQLPDIKNSGSVSWFLMNRKCPVLDLEKGTCSAYSVRPVACSTHFVTSKPELCDSWNSGAGDYSPVDFSDLYEEFQEKLATNIAGHGILSLELPLPQALLLAERINLQSGMSLDKAVSLFINEL